MLNSLELSLLHAIAYNPQDNSRFIVSPQAGRLRDWVQTPLAKRIFQAVGELALHQKHVNPLAISVSAHLDSAELTYLMSEWQAGKAIEPSDLEQTVAAIRNNYLVQASHSAMDDCKTKNLQAPETVSRNLSELGASLDVLAHDGIVYNPDPTSHLNDKGSEVNGTWHHKTFDAMFEGGVPSGGYSLIVGPSGHGKTSINITMASYMIAAQRKVMYATNESTIDAGEVSRRIKRALVSMWAGTREECDIEQDMRNYCAVYDIEASTHDIHQINRYSYWEQPELLIMDSLDNMNFVNGSDRYSEGEKHRIRAAFIASMSKERRCLINLVGNGSKSEQAEISKDISKVSIPMVYASIWYHNLSSYSYVFCRDKNDIQLADVKRCKTRGETGQIGQMFYLKYDPQGKYYAPYF